MGLLTGLGWCDMAYGDNRSKLCAWCGKPLGPKRRRWCSDRCGATWARNHSWTEARWAAMERDGHKCVKCGSRRALEVNHKTPVQGRHHVNGCHHHLPGLETLCHLCHVAETNRQRAAGLIGRNR